MMELLFNLAWLLLLLPAFALWRRRGHGSSSTTVLLALACLLLILFPVISVSDDLSLMRAEMEDTTGPERMASSEHGKHAGVSGMAIAAVYLVAAVYAASEGQSFDHVQWAAPALRPVSVARLCHPRSPPVA